MHRVCLLDLDLAFGDVAISLQLNPKRTVVDALSLGEHLDGAKVATLVTNYIPGLDCILAPVEPGNLLLMSYRDEVPILSAPGCFRSAKPNVVDMILPPLLARYRVTGWEVACLGHGGLLA